jgi:hypothetical protein
MSALPPKADMCSVKIDVCFVPIADIEHQAQPLLRRPSWEQSHSVTNFGASSRRRILWSSSSRSEDLTYEKVSLTSSWWALTYSSHLWTVVGDVLTIMRHSFYNDIEALLRRY